MFLVLVCHPLIHLAYAVELDSKEVGMEALALTAVCYDFLHVYVDESRFTRVSSRGMSGDLLALLAEVRRDGALRWSGEDGTEELYAKREDEMMEYWNAWDLTDPVRQFENSQRTAVALLCATGSYDFAFVQGLAASHAIRVLLPVVPAEWHLRLVRQWWLVTLGIYVVQQRPEIRLDDIHGFDVGDKDWAWVERQGLEREGWNMDAHYVGAIRALRECANLWGDEDQYFLKAAVKFAGEFDGWAPNRAQSE